MGALGLAAIGCTLKAAEGLMGYVEGMGVVTKAADVTNVNQADWFGFRRVEGLLKGHASRFERRSLPEEPVKFPVLDLSFHRYPRIGLLRLDHFRERILGVSKDASSRSRLPGFASFSFGLVLSERVFGLI